MNDRMFMHKYAMLFGTYMGAFWIAKFVLFPLGLTTPFLSLLFIVLTICVPFMGFYYTKMYRDTACNGSISFGHAWMFTLFMYMFASLLVAVAHYVYFQYIDQGYIYDTCNEQLNILAQSEVPNIDTYVNTYREALKMAASMSAIDITMQMLSTNTFTGMFLAIPTALFVMKKKKAEQ